MSDKPRTLDEKPKQEIDVLMKEFDHRFTEMMFHSQRYHKQADYISLYISTVIAVGVLIFSDKTAAFLTNHTVLGVHALPILYGMFLVFGILVVFYFFTSIMASLFMTYLNGVRMSAVEKLINEKMQRELLVWDTKIIPHFFEIGFVLEKGWLNPNTLVGIWIFLLFLFVASVFSVLCYLFLRQIFWFYFPVVVAASLFHIYQWVQLLSVGIATMKHEIDRFSGAGVFQQQNGAFPLRRTRVTIEHWVAICTVLFGFLPTAVMSIKANAFWLSSPYDFPFVAIPTVVFGDSILLPLLNYRFVRFVRYHTTGRFFKHRLGLAITVCLIALAFSVTINSCLNYLWTHDRYTGFMDMTLGQLSAAGWWHYAFSVAQTAVVLSFVGLWIGLYKNRKLKAAHYGYKTWKVFVVFTSIALADFAVRQFYVLKTGTLTQALGRDWSSFLSLLLSLGALVAGKILLKRVTCLPGREED